MTSLSSQLYAANYVLHDTAPTRLIEGEALLLPLEIVNTGAFPWLPTGQHPVMITHRWFNEQGVVVAEGLWRHLPCPIPPGTAAHIELRVESPPASGRHVLQIEMVEHGVAWFSERGVAPLRLLIDVVPASGPLVCIINGNALANDAVGSHVVGQILALRAGGYVPLLLTEFIDERLPRDVRRAMITISPTLFHHPDDRTRPAVEHFRRSVFVIVNYSTYYPLAELIREVQGAPVLFDYHGITPPHIWGADKPGYEELVRGVENLNLVRFADYGVGHSQYMADELVATGHIAASRVSVQPYPVVQRSAYADPPPPALIAEHQLEEKRVLLYVGRMARNKRIHDLVEAMPAILAQHPQTVLLLVGETGHAYADYVAETWARAEELGVSHAVIFTGAKNRSQVAEYYQLCDVFVMASIHEGFCMPVMEAMAAGKPVVAAAATALPSTVADAGLLFTPEQPAELAMQVCRLLDELPAPTRTRDPLALHIPRLADDDEIAALRNKTIAFVTPRYGTEVLGGAETGMRSWAEHLAALGYEVEALTTGVVDLTDWNDRLPLGEVMINGVKVRRFPVDRVDPGEFHRVLQKAHEGQQVKRSDEQRFMRNNVQSAPLTAYLAAHLERYACVFFAPYLFGTSYVTAQAAAGKAIMVPCLHDEPAAYFAVFREMLEEAQAIFFNTDAESDLASDKLQVVNPYRLSVGFGFDDAAPGDGARFRNRYGIQGPFLLYSGRLEEGKNVPLLIESFVAYKNAHPGPLSLVLTGHGSVVPPSRPDIFAVGMLERELLIDAYAACTALCQPSLNESFSIVMMEAWLQGRPSLVHADCAVTRAHVERSSGGLLFRDASSFAQAVDILLADEQATNAMGERGRAYVHATYSWPVVLDRLLRGIATFIRPRSLYNDLAQKGIRRALDFTYARFEEHLLSLTERALRENPTTLNGLHVAQLQQAAHVARPEYSVRSGLPVLGKLIAWTRRQLTSHLKEPYIDPVIADQERFNRELVETLLPALEASLREQRRLRAELDVLRERLEHKNGE